MIPKQAIEKAIEGGWKYRYGYDTGVQGATEAGWQEVALDPTFWQALGKALGWNNQPFTEEGKPIYFENTWLYHSCHFAKCILTGGDTEAFWNELLKEGWSVVESDRTD